jgi:prophage regulatory protein
MTAKILRPKVAQAKLGIGHTKYYELNKNDPTFPKDIILGSRARGKLEHELDAWIESKREGAPQ